MTTLDLFHRLQKNVDQTSFYEACKRIVAKKENYTKIVIQKAQQAIDNYLENKKPTAATVGS